MQFSLWRNLRFYRPAAQWLTQNNRQRGYALTDGELNRIEERVGRGCMMQVPTGDAGHPHFVPPMGLNTLRDVREYLEEFGFRRELGMLHFGRRK